MKRLIQTTKEQDVQLSLSEIGDGNHTRLFAEIEGEKYLMLEIRCGKKVDVLPCGPLPKDIFKADKDGTLQITRRKTVIKQVAK